MGFFSSIKLVSAEYQANLNTANLAAAQTSAQVTTELGGGAGAAAIGNAVGNLVRNNLGTAINQAVTILNQQYGMPAFLANDVRALVSEALKGLHVNTDPAVQQLVQGQAGASIEGFTQGLVKLIVDFVRNKLAPGSVPAPTTPTTPTVPAPTTTVPTVPSTGNPAPTGGTTGPSTGGAIVASGGSWMQAIAEAMGKALGEKARKLVTLSAEIADLTAGKPAQTGATEGTGTAQSEEQKKKDTDAKADAAAKTQSLNTQFQAVGQEFNLLQTTFSTAIKTIGEGMASVARKQ